MIDDGTGEAVCVIDLDTVMPGLPLYDFGDMVRSATNTGAEDDTNLDNVSMDMAIFEQLARGYLAATGGWLSDAEVDLLPFSGAVMTLECGIRFLADHLNGDVYFKIHRPGHNLDRCRNQFKLLSSIEEQMPRMNRVVLEARDRGTG